eukprot:TRINITY_DN1600_c0_g1_i6.p1 TRINITY_DN1600_c0_g1~~TRINITY_DN1600_c0_g1_i6.p1  ORF type:complete len:356 (+),score=52.01 TRINITY_DN1600_c0_g1_i6:82-1068(+)
MFHADAHAAASMASSFPSVGAAWMQKRHAKRKKDVEEGLECIRREAESMINEQFVAMKTDFNSRLIGFEKLLHKNFDRLSSSLSRDVSALQRRFDDMASSSRQDSGNHNQVDCLVQALGEYGVLSSSEFKSHQESVKSLCEDLADRVSVLEASVMTAASGQHAVSDSESKGSFEVGDIVCISGLQQQQKYNGMFGEVLAWNASRGRWQVSVHGTSECKLFAAKSLKLQDGPSHKKPRQEPEVISSSSSGGHLPVPCFVCRRLLDSSAMVVLCCAADGHTVETTRSQVPKHLNDTWQLFCKSCFHGKPSGDRRQQESIDMDELFGPEHG